MFSKNQRYFERKHNEMYMSWVSHWNDGWFIRDWFCTIYSTWINGSIRIDDSAICRNNNACYIADCDWGGLGYSSEGYLDYILLLQVLIGTMLGAYIGAKFTNYAPRMLLKFSMIMTPVFAGCMLLME